MKTNFFLALSSIAFCVSSADAQIVLPAPAISSAVKPAPNSSKSLSPNLPTNYGKLPLSFEANQGQTDPQVKFLSRGSGYSLFLTDSAAELALTKRDPPSSKRPDRIGIAGCPIQADSCGVGLSGKTQSFEAHTSKTDVVRMELAGASKPAHALRRPPPRPTS